MKKHKTLEQLVTEAQARGRKVMTAANTTAQQSKRNAVVAAVDGHKPTPIEKNARGGYVTDIEAARARGQAEIDRIKKVFPPARLLK